MTKKQANALLGRSPKSLKLKQAARKDVERALQAAEAAQLARHRAEQRLITLRRDEAESITELQTAYEVLAEYTL